MSRATFPSLHLHCSRAHSPTFPSLHLHYSRAHSPTFPSLHLHYSIAHSPNLPVTSPTSQLILQPSRRFTYVTTHSLTLPLLHLRHSSFSNPSFASPTSQTLHLRHLANRPCISTFVTFSQNIVADNDKNKALTDCHKCSSSFLSIVKSSLLKSLPVSWKSQSR